MSPRPTQCVGWAFFYGTNADSFTVTPNAGLGAGTYTAAITVSGDHGISESFSLSFTVSPVFTVTFDSDGGNPGHNDRADKRHQQRGQPARKQSG
jgi:hypothetical protein